MEKTNTMVAVLSYVLIVVMELFFRNKTYVWFIRVVRFSCREGTYVNAVLLIKLASIDVMN